jgi:hypothetical protein
MHLLTPVAAEFCTRKAQFDTGAISEADFKARLQDPKVQDGHGRRWIAARDGAVMSVCWGGVAAGRAAETGSAALPAKVGGRGWRVGVVAVTAVVGQLVGHLQPTPALPSPPALTAVLVSPAPTAKPPAATPILAGNRSRVAPTFSRRHRRRPSLQLRRLTSSEYNFCADWNPAAL